ncbi:MAG: AmmeMemoRadiSam system radical SAM enzyme [Neptuniibacter sp.]
MSDFTIPHPTVFWHTLTDGRVQCDLCPRYCKLKEGQRGLCFVRGCEDGEIKLYTWGRSSGFCIDPIEKKPLNHFYPGQPILSFGTAGCNLNCKFCQNWDMSKSREMDKLAQKASPQQIAEAAKRHSCIGVAFTYNDPVIFMEYAIDIADACHALGLKSVAVSAGYICDKPRKRFFSKMDAANIDLKSFNQAFYKKICGGDLAPVLDTLLYLKHETNTWFEITTLLIPDENDSTEELEALCRWVYDNLGPDIPIHFTAFHPDWKMLNKPRTPPTTLTRAREIAKKSGIHHPYTGNVYDAQGNSTYCHNCGSLLIERCWYELGTWNLDSNGECSCCGEKLSGKLSLEPGTWGQRRLPIRI